MVSLSGIKGQSSAISFLRSILSSGRIRNTLLFSGPEGVGKFTSAKAFVMALLCRNRDKAGEDACTSCSTCHRVDTFNHPDVLWIKQEKNSLVKIDSIRATRESLALRPYESERNVCVIENAHMMTEEAQNALLKLLEEPPAHSLIILITSKKELLLRTVRSRSLDVRFSPIPLADTEAILAELKPDLDKESRYFFVNLSQGSPGKAIQMIDEGYLNEKESLIMFFNSALDDKKVPYFDWEGKNKDKLIEDIELAIMFFRDIVFGKVNLEEMILDKKIINSSMYKFFRKYKLDKLCKIMTQLVSLKNDLTRGVNPRLVIQALPYVLI